MLSNSLRLSALKKGNFLVDEAYTLEAGGCSKERHEIREMENAWLVKDRTEYSRNGM